MQWAEDQSASRVELEDGTVLTKCDQCKTLYSEREPPEEPPCETCKVDLAEENFEANKIYNLVKGQVITLYNGSYDRIFDINHVAIWQAIDHYGIKDKITVFERVTRVFHKLLNEREKNEN